MQSENGKPETTPIIRWMLTSVPDGQTGRGDFAATELRTCLTEGWEPFAVASGRIWLRQKITVHAHATKANDIAASPDPDLVKCLYMAASQGPGEVAIKGLYSEAADEIERLRDALGKIYRRYPCESVDDMARVAKETLGVR